MAEFTYNAVQFVPANQGVVLNTSIGCPKGYVIHRNDSAIVTLRGIVNNPTACFARYQVTFNGNIAIPTGGTVGPIAVAIAIEGEPLLTSRAIVTPAAVDNYFNVTCTAFITVPAGCCAHTSVDCVAADETPTTDTQGINVQNANLVVTRVA